MICSLGFYIEVKAGTSIAMQIQAVLAGKGPAGAEGVARKCGCGRPRGSCRPLQWASGRTCCTLGWVLDSRRLSVSEDTNPTLLKLKMYELAPSVAIHPEEAPLGENWRHRERKTGSNLIC